MNIWTHQTAPTIQRGWGIRLAHCRFGKKGLSIRIRGEQKMSAKQVELPGPDHPISIERNPARVVVSVAGRVVADTRNALTLREAAYPAVQYIPREDVDFSQLEQADHVTYCPYKGDCKYYSVPAGGNKSVNALWLYEDPFPAVARIRGTLRSIQSG
jgi:uncharacterized protein (DUF427 family)